MISTSVQKTRYLSDGESFGVDLGLNVANEITEGRIAPILPWGLVKTHDIWANCELIDALDGALLWQTDLAQATDWQVPANARTMGGGPELEAVEETRRWREELQKATAHMTDEERIAYYRERTDAVEKRMRVRLRRERRSVGR